jgi:hypothetical protein
MRIVEQLQMMAHVQCVLIGIIYQLLLGNVKLLVLCVDSGIVRQVAVRHVLWVLSWMRTKLVCPQLKLPTTTTIPSSSTSTIDMNTYPNQNLPHQHQH